MADGGKGRGPKAPKSDLARVGRAAAELSVDLVRLGGRSDSQNLSMSSPCRYLLYYARFSELRQQSRQYRTEH